jgi:pectinesterase
MRVLLVGDSTVTDHEGWGRGLRARLVGEVECLNHAQGGRSSLSYRTEGFWDGALATGADYVLIQFGHNDEPGKGAERETDPDTTFPANMTRYVAQAREAGMTPVLLTSLTRRQFTRNGRLRDTLAPYVAAVRRVAAASQAPLVDLHAASSLLCESLGPQGCELLSPVKPDGGFDSTHLNAAGSLRFGGLVADLTRDAVPALRPYLTPAEVGEPAAL